MTGGEGRVLGAGALFFFLNYFAFSMCPRGERRAALLVNKAACPRALAGVQVWLRCLEIKKSVFGDQKAAPV